MAVRIGLIGAGRMGAVLAYHLAFSVEAAAFVAIVDPFKENAQTLAQKCRVANVYSDPDDLLVREDIQAVIIATPTHTHAELVEKAARAGKHIFVEKPLALTLAACDAALEAVSRHGVKLQVGFMRRYDPAYVAAKQKIDAGLIGAPVMFKGIGRDPWRTSLDYARRENSGGLIADMGIHDIDLALWLMGSEIVRVFSEGECLVFPELKEAGDIDNAVVNLKFASGAVGNIEVSRNAIYGYDIRTEVIGSEGAIFIGGQQQTMTWTLTKNSVAHDTIPNFMARFPEAYAAEIRDFVAAVEQDRPVAVTGQDARAATAIGIAATLSLDEGRPVELAEIL